jgi:GMP synthase-like glutamine amidotransferase
VIFAFRHVPFEPLGMIADALDSRRIEWRYVDLWASLEACLPIDNAQALIFMGGPMSVNDPLPWLRREEKYIVQAISSGVPVLGVCLGAQLLAKCLGARVYPMGHKEIGWHPVQLTEAGLDDPLLQGLLPEETVFHWHGDTFDLPAGAELLASSHLCSHQAFRHGDSLYGLQFHPEVSPEMIGNWLHEDANCGDLREVPGVIDPYAHQNRMRAIAGHIFGRWCDLVATR